MSELQNLDALQIPKEVTWPHVQGWAKKVGVTVNTNVKKDAMVQILGAIQDKLNSGEFTPENIPKGLESYVKKHVGELTDSNGESAGSHGESQGVSDTPKSSGRVVRRKVSNPGAPPASEKASSPATGATKASKGQSVKGAAAEEDSRKETAAKKRAANVEESTTDETAVTTPEFKILLTAKELERHFEEWVKFADLSQKAEVTTKVGKGEIFFRLQEHYAGLQAAGKTPEKGLLEEAKARGLVKSKEHPKAETVQTLRRYARVVRGFVDSSGYIPKDVLARMKVVGDIQKLALVADFDDPVKILMEGYPTEKGLVPLESDNPAVTVRALEADHAKFMALRGSPESSEAEKGPKKPPSRTVDARSVAGWLAKPLNRLPEVKQRGVGNPDKFTEADLASMKATRDLIKNDLLPNYDAWIKEGEKIVAAQKKAAASAAAKKGSGGKGQGRGKRR